MAEVTETPAAPAGSPGAAGAAREEAARQVVALVGMAAAVLVAVVVEKWATDPDAYRTAQMRGALAVEHAAMQVARAAAGLATRAREVYRAGCAG